MKKNIDLRKLDPVMRIALGKNLEQQRKFSQQLNENEIIT